MADEQVQLKQGVTVKIYDAIMKAADHIERHPNDFYYQSNLVPYSCGTPGCALGWIGHFLGLRGSVHTEVLPAIGLRDLLDFSMSRMDELVPVFSDWRHDPPECARALRLYAEKYHGHEKVRVPDWNAMADGPERVKDSARSEELAWA